MTNIQQSSAGGNARLTERQAKRAYETSLIKSGVVVVFLPIRKSGYTVRFEGVKYIVVNEKLGKRKKGGLIRRGLRELKQTTREYVRINH